MDKFFIDLSSFLGISSNLTFFIFRIFLVISCSDMSSAWVILLEVGSIMLLKISDRSQVILLIALDVMASLFDNKCFITQNNLLQKWMQISTQTREPQIFVGKEFLAERCPEITNPSKGPRY
eukprot:GFUD01000300.1.p1 GENE.GFUD01000300.1~~GFUD01000300.1.p1  ORF type:complete len:122 (+),score=9.03 GFUD01000300.1:116-481(+)